MSLMWIINDQLGMTMTFCLETCCCSVSDVWYHAAHLFKGISLENSSQSETGFFNQLNLKLTWFTSYLQICWESRHFCQQNPWPLASNETSAFVSLCLKTKKHYLKNNNNNDWTSSIGINCISAVQIRRLYWSIIRHLKGHDATFNSTDGHLCQSTGGGASPAISALWRHQAAGTAPVSFRLMMQSSWLDSAWRNLDWSIRCMQMTRLLLRR